MLAALLLLMATGVVLSFAASPPVAERLGLGRWHFIVRQAIFAALAVPVLIGTSFLPHRAARWAALAVLAVSVVLLWMTLRFGVEVKGARRWVSLLGQTVQPSEFVKPAFAVIGAWLFAESMKQKGIPARTMATGLMLLIVAALLRQPDIGQTALVFATWAALRFLPASRS